MRLAAASARRCRWSPGRPPGRRAGTAAPSRAMRLPSSSRPTRRRQRRVLLAPQQGVPADEVALVQLHRPAQAGLEAGRSPRSARGRTAAWRLPAAACRGRPGRTAWPPRPTSSSHSVDGLLGRDHDLDAVLAGVAGAADDARPCRGSASAWRSSRRACSASASVRPRHSSERLRPLHGDHARSSSVWSRDLARRGRPCAASSQATILARLEALTTIAQP